MKKVIKGALYNTETAQRIGSYGNGEDRDEPIYFQETLYRTKFKKYFLHCEGGPLSMHCDWRGSQGHFGENIYALTPEQANNWAESNLPADIYMRWFGEVEEAQDGREVLTTTLPTEIKRKLEDLRNETGKSIGELIAEKFSE